MMNTIRTSGQLSPILKQLRKDKGWSQIELGRRIGLSQERISAIENHPEKTSIDQLFTLLMALDAELQVGPRQSLSDKEALSNVPTAKRKNTPRENW